MRKLKSPDSINVKNLKEAVAMALGRSRPSADAVKKDSTPRNNGRLDRRQIMSDLS